MVSRSLITGIIAVTVVALVLLWGYYIYKRWIAKRTQAEVQRNSIRTTSSGDPVFREPSQTFSQPTVVSSIGDAPPPYSLVVQQQPSAPTLPSINQPQLTDMPPSYSEAVSR